ncbi:putative ABC transport system permease protein [Pseudonocardia ammonioxydans]|uniref:Putative ABC transport system permease protein n=1 Tax=Pseudonocardia ammonioxydans TaxID=260086 RepID=A0A1I4SAY5_PSUAM|nr:ABC transporter permease [Pseudonocardia ammonioxydans]SFM61686.1 putative ABC transport system permease protein [Pseudonocardia ammonioxydans]
MRALNPATRAAVAGIRRNPRQTVLTGLAVLVATVFSTGSVVFTDTLREALLAGAPDPESVSATVASVLAGLSVFVGLALIAATVVVGSTFRIVLARRGRELALLRCVGASRSQVTRSVLAEAAVTGLVAGVGGAVVAVVAGHLTIAVLQMSGVDVPGPVLQPAGPVGCVLLAVVATVVAAVPSALAAGRVPPVVALGEADGAEARGPDARRRVPLAVMLVVATVAVGARGLAVPDALGALGLVALSGMVLFAALVVAGPLLVAAAATALRPLAARSAPARLAVANARRVSRRTAATTTVLALGVGLTAALLVGIEGASADARASIERNYPAEVLVLPDDRATAPDRTERQAVADAAAARLAERPELRVRTDGTEVLVDPAPGADPQAVRDAVASAGDGAGTQVIWTAERRAETEQVLGTVRAVSTGLVGVTLVVAVLGMGVTLALSLHERTREIALLRALGLTRSGARYAVAAEAAIAGLVGAVPGVVLGAGYGVLGLLAVGIPVPTPPAGQLAGLGTGIVVVAVLAAAASMRRVGRVAPAHGLATG